MESKFIVGVANKVSATWNIEERRARVAVYPDQESDVPTHPEHLNLHFVCAGVEAANTVLRAHDINVRLHERQNRELPIRFTISEPIKEQERPDQVMRRIVREVESQFAMKLRKIALNR